MAIFSPSRHVAHKERLLGWTNLVGAEPRASIAKTVSAFVARRNLVAFPLPFRCRLREHPRMKQEVNAPAWQTRATHAPPEFAGVTTLGELVHAYPPREDALKEYRPLGILGGGLVAAGVVIAVIVALCGSPKAALPALTPSAIGGVIFVLYAMTLRRFRGSVRSVAVFDKGFATLVGSQLGVWPWAEITSIVSTERFRAGSGGSTWTTRYYELSTRAGGTLAVTDDWFEDVRVVIAAIKAPVFAVLRPPLQEQYAAGTPVTFGPVTVSKEAVVSNGRRIAWVDVREASVKQGGLIVTPLSGAPLNVRVSLIPNVEVLGTLIGVDPATMSLAYI
jgi:hypothetical protein